MTGVGRAGGAVTRSPVAQAETASQTDWLAVGGVLALLAAVGVPFLVPMLPQLYLQFDPRAMARAVEPSELGPTGIVWWQAYALAASGAAMLIAWRRGVRIAWWMIALGAIAMIACGVHIFRGSMNDRLTAGAWLAAVALGLAAAHLGPLRDAQRWAAAALVALLVPVALDAAYYVFISHPATVQNYLDQQTQLLSARGWEPGSAEALKYEQRLKATDATGAFGLSNVLGSFAAAFSLLAVATAAGLYRRSRPAASTAGLAALLGLVTLGFSQSKGAIAACVAGAALLGMTSWLRRRGKTTRLAGGVALGLVVIAMLAVAGRGMMGAPEDASGERSILFRFHYLQGAAAMFVGQLPQAATLGVGPDGFAALYPRYKNPISPETVTSAHNVFADYILMLGLGGLAAAGLLVAWVFRGMRGVDTDRLRDAIGPLRRANLIAAGVLGAAVFGVAYAVEMPAMGPDQAVLWLVGLLGFVLMTATLARPGAWSVRAQRVGLFVAAATLLIHGQIEMTFLNLASVGPAWFVLGLCGAGANDQPTRDARPGRVAPLPGAALLVVAMLFAAGNASLVSRQQAHVARAASALSVNNWQLALAELDRSAAYIAVDDKPLRYRVGMRLEMAAELARAGSSGAARERLDAALAIVDEAQQRGLNPTTAHRYRAQVYRHAAERLGVQSAWPLAAAALRAATERSPYNAHLHLDAADFAARAGQHDEAQRLYRRALELHELNYLDEAHQLSEEALQRIEAALNSSPSAPRGRGDRG